MRGAGCLALLAAGCAGAGVADSSGHLDPATTVALGAGRFSTVPAAGEKPPSDFHGQPVRPKVTADFEGPPVTNDWWSSLIWRFDRGGKPNPYSEPMFAHPLALAAEARGLGLGYPREPRVSARAYAFPYRRDLLVGVEGLESPDARVARYADWIVTARWGGSPGPSLEATFGHGLPFAYFEARGGHATVELADAEVRVFAEGGAWLGLTVGGRAYGLFAPPRSRWTREGRRVRGELAGGGAFSVAALPDDRPATLARFRRHALAFVTGARVSWRYDEAAAALHTTFTLETQPRGDEAVPLVALYPHQWKHLGRDLGPPTYASPRGPMKLLAARSFETTTPFAGVLPVLPFPRDGGFDPGALKAALRAAARPDDLFPPGLEGTKGTYWTGKSLVRVAQQAWLADQAGEPAIRDRLVAALERVLEDWFDGRAPNLFYYDRTWATVIGLPSEYRSGWELNDHHFHYGQFVLAAATVARFDPGWARPERWGGMVDLLISDCASADRGDRRFPFLRAFDPYAGHSWANGPATFEDGNNEESSSEDANFAAAVILWGALTGRREVRDLGIFLHANLTAAIAQYWFDVDGENFPAGFGKRALGMVWGSGGRYDTWWDRNPIYVHGINFLPLTAGSLYLGRDPAYVRRNYEALIAANGGPPGLWRDIVWMYLGLTDPRRALAELEQSPRYEPEFGSSRPFVYHWLHALQSYGQVDAGVSADLPTFAVLLAAGTRSHVAFNPSPSPARVHFSDGVGFELAPFEQKVVSAPAERPTASR